jgi:phosphoribosylformylglycinamidine synthase
MFAHLREMIPGASEWPLFKGNRSGRFEARVCMVQVVETAATKASPFLRDLAGSMLPVAVAHGEGRASFNSNDHLQRFKEAALTGVRYIDSQGAPTAKYPLNPNGSPDGITGVQSTDGRFLALMPHPERVITTESNSWHPESIGPVGPWFQLFKSARSWCGP